MANTLAPRQSVRDPVLIVRGLAHRYGPMPVFENLDLVIGRGERVAVVGPSGCGKTTLLQLCAGLITARCGDIERHCSRSAVVFQAPTLLPWMNALDNIDLGLKAAGVPKETRRQRSRHAAAAFGLGSVDLEKYPHQLSGGMQCRVALARAFVIEPDLVFLDEPFSALDVGLKTECHEYLLRYSGIAVFFITHDLMEAVRLADRIVLLGADPGRWIGEYRLQRPPGQRQEADIHADTRALLERPEVRDCFGLPPDKEKTAAARTGPAVV